MVYFFNSGDANFTGKSPVKLLIIGTVLLLLATTMSCLPSAETDDDNISESISQPAPTYTYKVINSYPHDRDAFTQGLAFEKAFLYESTGRYGSSSLRKVDIRTGEVLQVHSLSDQYFGEGITIFGDTIIQLTWRSKKGFVYDKDSFESLREFTYDTEGWGITHDGEYLIMSDGTSSLHLLDPDTFKLIDHIQVHDNNQPIVNLNELEFVKGQVYANVWGTDKIAMIDPNTGHVTGWIDLSNILPPQTDGNQVDVLNGIAYDSIDHRLFVTGKWWPLLFEIELVSTQ
jgi:glutamine cyclotransferase